MTEMRAIAPARSAGLSTIQEIIDEARRGRMFILVDDEDRENEGDLIVPAQMASAEAINFMAAHGRGLVCLALTEERVSQLRLARMSATNGARFGTAFTVSIEAREGVTTGISAADRARTIAVAIDPTSTPEAIVSPGHVFPLAARAGGVLVRPGHTEAAVDVARLAGLNPSGVICEILNDDGGMARLGDLVPFARRHGLKIGTIRDLVAYRERHDHLLRRVSQAEVTLGGATWTVVGYRDAGDQRRHVALQLGTVDKTRPTLVRMHRLSLLDDVFGRSGPGQHLAQRAMDAIARVGRGVVVLVGTGPEPMPDGVSGRDDPGHDDVRAYGVGAQILSDLGVGDVDLLVAGQANFVALDGWDIRIVAERRL